MGGQELLDEPPGRLTGGATAEYAEVAAGCADAWCGMPALPPVTEEVIDSGALTAAVSEWGIVQPEPGVGGALRHVALLGPDDDIARFEYLKKSARNFGSVLLGIETSAPENFVGLFERIEAAGLSYEDISENEILANFLI